MTLPSSLHPKARWGTFRDLKNRLYGKAWVVYAKETFGGPEQVFKYLGQYTHRVGISNWRLVSMDERGICFRTRGAKTVIVSPEEFIQQYLLHVLPPRFVKIRHYGLMASGNATTRLEVARALHPRRSEDADARPRRHRAPARLARATRAPHGHERDALSAMSHRHHAASFTRLVAAAATGRRTSARHR